MYFFDVKSQIWVFKHNRLTHCKMDFIFEVKDYNLSYSQEAAT